MFRVCGAMPLKCARHFDPHRILAYFYQSRGRSRALFSVAITLFEIRAEICREVSLPLRYLVVVCRILWEIMLLVIRQGNN